MSLYDWLTPDLGFPDKEMWDRLSDRYPNENWTRNRIQDMYRWYEIAINQHSVPYFDIDTNNRTIFNWMKQHTPYSSTQIDRFAEVFEEGVREMWLEPQYVGSGIAPPQFNIEAKKTLASLNIYDKLKWGAILAIVGYSAFYVMPVLGKLGKKIK